MITKTDIKFDSLIYSVNNSFLLQNGTIMIKSDGTLFHIVNEWIRINYIQTVISGLW